MRTIFSYLLVLILLGSTTNPVLAKKYKVEDFSNLPDISMPSISKSGRYLAFKSAHNNRAHLSVMDTTGKEKERMIAPFKTLKGHTADLLQYFWKGDDFLILYYKYATRVGGQAKSHFRLLSFNMKTNEFMNLYRIDKTRMTTKSIKKFYLWSQSTVRIIDPLPNDPDHILTSMAGGSITDYVIEVRKVNLKTGLYNVISAGRKNIYSWMTDQDGELRLATGSKSKGVNTYTRVGQFKDPKTNEWVDISNSRWFNQRDANVIGFTEDPNFAYIIDYNGKNTLGLYVLDIMNDKVVKTLYHNDKYDIDGVFQNPGDNRPFGVNYTSDYSNTIFFDQNLAGLQAQFKNIFKGGQIEFSDINSQIGQYIIKHSSEKNPGTYYLLDAKKNSIKLIGHNRNAIKADDMAEVKAVTFKARDGWDIPGYLTIPKGKKAKSLPTVVLVHGGPWARDTMTFDSWAQYIANQGYMVFQPNFRGSSGFGRKFEKAGFKEWGGKMQDDVTDGTKWLIKSGMADKNRICIVGASYGGYAAAMGVVKEPDLYTCASSINGVLDYKYKIEVNSRNYGVQDWMIERLTMDEDKFEAISPAHQAHKIKVPIQLIHSKSDTRVPYNHSLKMQKALEDLNKSLETVYYDEGDHFLLTNKASKQTLEPLVLFLKKHLK